MTTNDLLSRRWFCWLLIIVCGTLVVLTFVIPSLRASFFRGLHVICSSIVDALTF